MRSHRVSWRSVFLLMLPIAALAALLTLPGLRRLRRAEAAATTRAPAAPWGSVRWPARSCSPRAPASCTARWQ
ncbi:hypothetical protein [Kitasatospora sp. NPDC057500]|uniref:hypothetical protein n=1 Tax=Kitasatospora sp. NPDC057500 TaxID=3346151 RepID=UPI0036C9A4EF